MQRLTRQHRFRNHGDLSTLPKEPPLRVAQGESFIIETVDTGDIFMTSDQEMDKPNGTMAGNPSTGPVWVEGIRAGEVMAVTIEELSVVGHCKIGIGDETLLPPEKVMKRSDFIRIADGYAHFRGGFRAPVRPMFGCFGVVPLQPNTPEPWHHGGNLDLPDVCAGSTIHVRAERDGGWFCCGDGHALQGDGEINCYSLEVSLQGRLRIERSPYQVLRTILIERPDRYITVAVESSFGDSIKMAEQSMAEFLAACTGADLLDAYQLASHVADIRVGPLWLAVRDGKWSGSLPIPACVQLPKECFRRHG